MDYVTLSEFIQTVGFPVVVCCGLFWYLIKADTAHKEEVKQLSEAVNNNTLVMQKLVDRMEMKGE